MLKKVWKWIINNKMSIAAFYWGTLAIVIKIWFPDGLPSTWEKIYLSFGEILTFLGIGYNVIKSKVTAKQKNEK